MRDSLDSASTSRMRAFVTLMLILLMAPASAGAQVVHLVGPGSKTKSPVAPELIARRIGSAARQYQQYAPIPRGAFFDIAYPADTGEYRRMAGYGILFVTAISQMEDELPVTPYLTTTGGDVPLRLITSVVGSAQPDDSIVRAVFGTHRIDALYLIPLDSRGRGADLLVDFAKNRQRFKLGTVAATLPPELQVAESARPTTAEPGQDAVLNMIRREYPGFVTSQ